MGAQAERLWKPHARTAVLSTARPLVCPRRWVCGVFVFFILSVPRLVSVLWDSWVQKGLELRGACFSPRVGKDRGPRKRPRLELRDAGFSPSVGNARAVWARPGLELRGAGSSPRVRKDGAARTRPGLELPDAGFVATRRER